MPLHYINATPDKCGGFNSEMTAKLLTLVLRGTTLEEMKAAAGLGCVNDRKAEKKIGLFLTMIGRHYKKIGLSRVYD